jgi:hypothetical protein
MSKKPAEPMKMVLVEWDDAYTQDSGWKPKKLLLKAVPVLVRTVGWLVNDQPEFLTVSGSHVPCDDHFDGDCTIPRGMIKSIVELKA